MVAHAIRRSCWIAIAALALTGLGCATSTGITVIDPVGKTMRVTPEEMAAMSGGDQPYLLQVGDEIDLAFRVKNFSQGDVPWDYRLEVGDSMEVRLSPETLDSSRYLIDTGDVIGVSFLNNWPLNVTRTVRPDGKVSLTQVGDVQAAGLTPPELQQRLVELYKATQIIQGEPDITVNVDFVNLDRLESVSRNVTVRADGKIRLPGLKTDVHVAGLTLTEAAGALGDQMLALMRNKPIVGLVVFPGINHALASMNGVLTIRPDGKISVPRIGDVQAAGFSVEELRTRLGESAKTVAFNPIDPAVRLVTATGSRVYVGGEVGVPGVYPLASSPTALQAIMMARGLQNTSRLRSVIVMRRNPEGKPFVFKTNLYMALYKGYTENDIALRPFDVVYVPKKMVSRANLFVTQYIDDIVPFNNSLGVSGTYYLNTQRVHSVSHNGNLNLNVGPGSFVP
ncbi:MAG TPA: polysaccharide biosynthesis/export family protein [Candidatus Hydrogenedentes bacterium]|nr:polysaccharide biosynthesis/export family protein [Candidatus Hydrogenedentota bacterium]